MSIVLENPLIVCGPSMTIARAILNTNAFPQEAKREADVCANRLSLFLHNARRLRQEIDDSQSALLKHLKRNWVSYRHAVTTRPDLHVTAYWHGAEYVTVFHSVLYEMKAFLDLYARLIVKLMGGGGPTGFNKGTVRGKSIPGGRLYNWLRVSKLANFP